VFRCNPENKGKFITTGIWRYSRHPNYFGEILMWFSLAISVTMADQTMYWSFLSPLFSSFLLLCLSGVPMVERAGKKKWGDNPEYVAYMENTSCLIPWFPNTKNKGSIYEKLKD